MFVGINPLYSHLRDRVANGGVSELHISQFLKDCLSPEIDFQLKGGSVIVYKQLDTGISEEISVDELIYFIHYDVEKYIARTISDIKTEFPQGEKRQKAMVLRLSGSSVCVFHEKFNGINSIRIAVENMKIILKYGKEKDDEDDDEKPEETVEEPLMTEVSTVEITSDGTMKPSNELVGKPMDEDEEMAIALAVSMEDRYILSPVRDDTQCLNAKNSETAVPKKPAYPKIPKKASAPKKTAPKKCPPKCR